MNADLKVIMRLGALGFLCALLIGGSYQLNAQRIQTAEQDYTRRQLLAIVAEQDWQLQEITENRYGLYADDQLQGFLFPIETNEGYNGQIRLWLAVSLSGEVLGVRVRSHQETPGLGDKIELPVSDWILDFNDKMLTDTQWGIKPDGGQFDSFTGASITPRAVVAAVEQGLQDFRQQQRNWLEDVDESN